MSCGNEAQVYVERLAGLVRTADGCLIPLSSRLELYLLSKTRLFQYPFHRVGADQWHPVVGFSQLIRYPSPTPLWVLDMKSYRPLLNLRRCSIGLLWRSARELFQTGVALLIESVLPVIECGSAYVSLPTGLTHVTGLFPAREQELALLCSCKWKIYVLITHTSIITNLIIVRGLPAHYKSVKEDEVTTSLFCGLPVCQSVKPSVSSNGNLY